MTERDDGIRVIGGKAYTRMVDGTTRCEESSSVFQAQNPTRLNEARGSIRSLQVNGRAVDPPCTLRAGDRLIVLGTGELFHASLRGMPWPEAREVRK